MELKLTVNLADLDLADTISRKYDDDTTIGEEVVRALVREIAKGDEYKSLSRRVLEIRDEEIKAMLAPILAEAVDRPIERTNSFGERMGAQTTLRELIMERTRKTLGISTEDRYRDGRYEHSTTLEKLVRSQVDAAIKEEIAEAVKAAKEAVPSQLGASIGATVAAVIRDALAKRG